MPRILMSVFFFVVIAGYVGASVLCAHAGSIETYNYPCLRLLTEYKKHSKPKAFAVTTNAAGNGLSQYCGAAWSAGSKEKAEQLAMSMCKTKKVGKEWNSSIPQSAKCKVTQSE